MYSVLRLIAEPAQRPSLWDLGEAMNRRCLRYAWVQRDVCDGLACEVSQSQDWTEHISALCDILQNQQEFLTAAISGGASATLDVAIEAEDQRSAFVPLVLPLEPALLAALASLSVRLEVSVY